LLEKQMKFLICVFAFLLSVTCVFAQGLRLVSVSFNGQPELVQPLENNKWHVVEAKYESKGNTNSITNCFFGLAKSGAGVTTDLLMKYNNQDKKITIVKHGTWNEPEMAGLPGEKKVIENDFALVDLEKTKVFVTKDDITVTYRLKLKDTFKGSFSAFMYTETTDGNSTGFVNMGAAPVGDPKDFEGSYVSSMPKEWKNSLKPKGGVVLNLASNKKTNYKIVIPANAKIKEQKAASDIARYFGNISGATFKIVKDNEFKGGKFISIGATKQLASSTSKWKNSDLKAEGYAIDIINGNLYLYGGRTRGLLDGIYSMLEEDLGCRWYTNSFQYIPKMSSFKVSIAPRKYLPALDLRDPYVFESWDSDWSLKNRTNAPNATIPVSYGGSIKYHFLVHTYATYFPANVYFKDHPEYYSLINGVRTPVQLCNTNPDVVRLSIEKTKQIFRDDPSATITSISPNDGRGFCDCPNCKALDDANGGRSGSYFYLVNKVAEGIKDEFPDKKILALAYLDYANPPTNMKIDDNVVVQLCTDAHAWKYQFCFTTESNDFQNYMKKWGASGAGIFIWDYVTDYVHMLVPMANMPVVADNIRFYIKNNAKGVMLQGTYMSNAGDMADMRSWVWAKQLWDPSLDTKTLMKDFIYGYYQECAKPMWDYQMMQWNYWEKYHAMPHKPGEKSDNPLLNNLMCSYAPDGPMFTKEFMDNFWKDITTAEKLAKTDDMKWRIKKVKASLLYLELAQNVGYMTEFRDFKPGKEFKNGKLNNKAKYVAYYKEFKEIIDHCRIVAVSEQNDLSKILAKWDAAFAATGEAIPQAKISNEWLFVVDRENKGLNEKWFENQNYYNKATRNENEFGGGTATTGVADDGTARIRVDAGAGWEAQGFPDYDGYGWYFQTFKLNDEVKNANKKVLYFGGVDEEAWVYVNGKLVLEHTIAATGKPASALWNEPFIIDVTDMLNQDGVNTIAVRVYDSSNMGGIWKPVSLFGLDKVLPIADYEMLR